MSNKIAILLGCLVIAALAYDQVQNDGTGTLFLARKLDALIEWLAFWR